MDSNQLHWLTLILQGMGTVLILYGVVKLAFWQAGTPVEHDMPETEEQAEDEIERLERELRRL